MLVCLSCNIEYKEDKKFCSYCGGSLVTKEDLTQGNKNLGKKAEEESGQKLVCPRCQMIYEFGSSCIQCGVPLERKIPLAEKEAPEMDLETPRPNLICPTCKVTYDHGNFCITCGLTLVPQASAQTEEEPGIPRSPEEEEKPIPLQTSQEQMDEAPRERLICPDCKIIYERGTSCVRCGTALVIKISSQEEKKTEQPEVSEAKTEELQVAPTPEEEIKEELPQTQPPEEKPSRKKDEEFGKGIILPRKPKRDYRRLSRDLGGITIMVVAGGYFVWAIYSHLITRPPEPKTATSKEAMSQVISNPPPSANPGRSVTESEELKYEKTKQSLSISKEATSSAPASPSLLDASKTPSPESREIENVKALLEKIRQANLRKDIDLFLSCYAFDFKDREGKKKATLAHWKNFDYMDLRYDLKNPLISGDSAKARVEWLIKITPYSGGRPQESKTILDVTLTKEGEGWKIKEVKQP